jgi:hypothetical protein
MRLFLDASVLLAAAGSARGASRVLFRIAPRNSWTLVATPYVTGEVQRNLQHLPPTAVADWPPLQSELLLMDDVLTLTLPAVFSASKDRPILFSALAWADVLLTLDRADFAGLLGGNFYGLPIFTPGDFLEHERTAGRLKL